MKRLSIYLSVLAAIVACSKPEEPVEENSSDKTEDLEIQLADNQILCSIPTTRTSLDGDLNVIWNEGDEIAVFGETAAATYRFSSFPVDGDERIAIFECGESGIKEGSRSAIYPADAYVPDSYDGKTAKVSLGGITSEIKDADDALSKEKNISPLPMVSAAAAGTLTFDNLFGGIVFRAYDHMGIGIKISKISVKATDGRAIAGTAAVDMTTGKIKSFSGEESVLTYEFPATDISAGVRNGFTAYLPVGEYAHGLVITIIDHLGRMFPVNTGAVTISAGKITTLPELPLSIYYGSANSVVAAPGTASVTIDVTPRYTYKGSYNMTDGKPIRVENGNISHYGKDARIVWQQKENSDETDLTASSAVGTIISGEPVIKFNDSKGTAAMTVPLTGEAGNAVVAIGYGDATAWSYHIWVSENEDVTIGGRVFMDRNLGAVSTTPGDRDSYGLCYQWGRKDPFPRIVTDEASAVSSYKSQGDLLKTVNKATGGTIGYTIQHPDTRITSGKSITPQNGDHWFADNTKKDTRLWGCSKTFGSSSDAKTGGTSIKTFFDPCPEGYKVPTYGDLAVCAGGTRGSATKGRTLDGNYFPFGGFIRLEESYLSSGETGWMTDTRGYLWSSTGRSSSNEQGAYILKYNKDYFDSNNDKATDPNGTGRGDQIFGFMCDAYPVRCIRETSSGTSSGTDADAPYLDEGEVLLNTVFDMNKEDVQVNSHFGLESFSCLQPMYNNIFTLSNSTLTASISQSEQKKAFYPRVKRRKDGGVVLFYQGGQNSSRILTMNADSFNGLKDAAPKIILTPYADSGLTAKYKELTGKTNTVYQRYMNMDAVVMPDGEIIGVVQHHAWDYKEVGYYQGEGTAIELMRSKDGGDTWTEPVEIYSGTCWEPYLLLLPDGTLQMYFTDSDPFIYSSQTSMISSSDKGNTWSEKTVVARRYKFDYDGKNTDRHGDYVYTDQMPCFRLLNDGKTYAGFLEGRLEDPMSYAGDYTSYHKMSLVKSSENGWVGITKDSRTALPVTRKTDALSGTGGYIECFPSGETVISCSSYTGPFVMKILDCECSQSFLTWDDQENTWFKRFGEKSGVWGSIERYNDNILMATAGNVDDGLYMGLYYLNQHQFAHQETIIPDGNSEDWTTTKALFLCSENGTEVIMRFAYDADYFYVLAETCHNGTNEDFSITFGENDGTVMLSANGELNASEGISALMRRGKTSDSRSGYCIEMAVPLSSLGGIGGGDWVNIEATIGGKPFTNGWSQINLY